VVTVRYILKNRWYIGEREYNLNFKKKTKEEKEEENKLPKEKYKIAEHLIFHELNKVVGKDTLFNLAQIKLEENKTKSKPHVGGILNPFEGILFCQCNERMRIKQIINNKNEKAYYYLCRSKVLQVAHAFASCQSKVMKKETLEQIVWKLFNIDNTPQTQIFEVDGESKKEETQKKKQEINQRIVEIENQIQEKEEEKLYNFRVGRRSQIPEENLIADGKRIQAEIDELKKIIITLESELFEINENEKNENLFDELTSKFQSIENDKLIFKSYVKKLIKRIVIYSGETHKRDVIIEITYFNNRKSFVIYNPFSIKTKDKFILLPNTITTKSPKNLELYMVQYNKESKRFDLFQKKEKKAEITVENLNQLYYQNKKLLINNNELMIDYNVINMKTEINTRTIEIYSIFKKYQKQK
jgi:hypothetical protein